MWYGRMVTRRLRSGMGYEQAIFDSLGGWHNLRLMAGSFRWSRRLLDKGNNLCELEFDFKSRFEDLGTNSLFKVFYVTDCHFKKNTAYIYKIGVLICQNLFVEESIYDYAPSHKLPKAFYRVTGIELFPFGQ